MGTRDSFLRDLKKRKGMSGHEKTILQLFVILALSYVYGDGYCNQAKGSLTLVGVFDFNDISSVKTFENAISRQNSVRYIECVPKLTYKTLIVKNGTSVQELMDLVDTALQGGTCFMIYASENINARIVLDIATHRGLNIITAVEEFDIRSSSEKVNYNYDPLSVASMNRITSAETKISALLAFLNHLKWTKFVAVTDNDHESTSFVRKLEGHLRARNMEMIDWFLFTEDDSADDMSYKFNNLGNGEFTFILVTNNLTMAYHTFGGASMGGKGTIFEQWVVVSDLDAKLIASSHFPPYAYSLSPKTNQEITLRGFVDDSVRLISHALAKRPHNMVSTCPKMNEVRRLLSEVDFHGSSGPVKLDRMGNRVPLGYDVYSLIPQDQELPTHLEQLGYWHNGKLFITEQSDKVKLKILINEYPPMIMSKSKLPGESCESIWTRTKPCIKTVNTPDGVKKIELCCYGFVIDVLGLVGNQYDFTPEILFTLDGQYGVYDHANDSWNGVVAELLNGRGDASFDLYISSRRATVMEFTEPYMPSGIRLLVKESEREDSEIVWLSYLRPFTTPVWLTLLGSLGVVTLFLWGIDKISPVRGSKKLFHQNSAFGLDNAICFALALAFGRPADEAKPTTNGARLSSVAFGMAMLVFVSTYSANLAAFLIVDDKTTPVKDIYDLKIERPPTGFKYGTISGTYMADYFKNSNNTYFHHIWSHMQTNNVNSLHEGVKAVRTGAMDVFIADEVSLDYESMNNCGLKVVGEAFAMSGTSIAVKKGNPLFKPLNEALQKVKANGLTDFIQRFWVKKYGSCTRDSPPAQLKLEDLSGLFLQLTIAMIGCILGTLCHSTFLKVRKQWTHKADDQYDKDVVTFSQLETLV